MITFTMLGSFGRMGNQLFQIAAAIGHAKTVGTTARFPKIEFAEYLANPIPTGQCGGKIWTEPHFHYAEIPKEDNLDLRGYFQSERYFEHCKDEVRNAFQIRPDLAQQALDKYPIVKDQESVSVHVRRGDYVNLADNHPPVTMEYINTSLSSFTNPKVVVFSDDMKWCEDNIRGNTTFVRGCTPFEDMFLMSQCRGHIIANSSFSWWGAWLDSRPDKVVFAPSRWFGPAYASHNTSDLVPISWRRA